MLARPPSVDPPYVRQGSSRIQSHPERGSSPSKELTSACLSPPTPHSGRVGARPPPHFSEGSDPLLHLPVGHVPVRERLWCLQLRSNLEHAGERLRADVEVEHRSR